MAAALPRFLGLRASVLRAPLPSRFFSTTPRVWAAAPAAKDAPPSVPAAAKDADAGATTGTSAAGEEEEGKSATPAGTVLTGLSIFKDKPDPVAHPDTWYPSWLWDVNTRRGVEEESNTGPGGLGAWHLDTTGMTKGQARTAEKRLVRERRRQMRLAEKARLRKEALLAEKLARGEKIEEEDPEEAWRLAEQEAERKKKEEHEYYLRTGITPRLQAVHESKAKLSQKGRASIREANFVKKSA